MLKEQFSQILQELSDLTGVEMRPNEETGATTFLIDSEVIVNLTYLDESDTILIFSPVGGFGKLTDADAGAKALAASLKSSLEGSLAARGFDVTKRSRPDSVGSSRCLPSSRVTSA